MRRIKPCTCGSFAGATVFGDTPPAEVVGVGEHRTDLDRKLRTVDNDTGIPGAESPDRQSDCLGRIIQPVIRRVSGADRPPEGV